MPELKLPSAASSEIEQSVLRKSEYSGIGYAAGSPDPSVETGLAELQDIQNADAPRVDEAMQAVLDRRNAPYVETREQLAAVGEEVRSLGYRGSDIVANIRQRIRKQPLQAIGIAALVGFVYGMVR